MNRKEIIQDQIAKINESNNLNLSLGIYNNMVEKMTKKSFDNVIEEIKFLSSTDVDVRINRKDYVAEISVFDDIIDINILNKDEYINLYGDERYCS